MVQTKTYLLTQRYYNYIISGRKARHGEILTEVVCHKCEIPLKIDDTIVTKQTHSRTKRSYYHPKCAELCHIL